MASRSLICLAACLALLSGARAICPLPLETLEGLQTSTKFIEMLDVLGYFSEGPGRLAAAAATGGHGTSSLRAGTCHS